MQSSASVLTLEKFDYFLLRVTQHTTYIGGDDDSNNNSTADGNGNGNGNNNGECSKNMFLELLNHLPVEL